MKRWGILLFLALPLHGQVRFEERVDVERIILDAYITDSSGAPIEGLTVEDFEVRIGGKRAEIDAVDWIPVERVIAGSEEETPVVVREGRLIVFFFQTDFGRNQARVQGHMKIIPEVIRFLDDLYPSDLVAVVQFDSHLKIRADFTNDREALGKTVEQSLLIDQRDPLPPSDYPSLLRDIDTAEAKRVANPERALLVLARALNEIKGAKALVMFGYGLGVYSNGAVSMRRDYGLARLMLEQSRTTVFSLDITVADYHSLEAGLQQVSRDTGGFYVRTHLFPALALERLANTLSGRYEIVLKKPDIRPGRHDVVVRVDRRWAFVQVQDSLVIGR